MCVSVQCVVVNGIVSLSCTQVLTVHHTYVFVCAQVFGTSSRPHYASTVHLADLSADADIDSAGEDGREV